MAFSGVLQLCASRHLGTKRSLSFSPLLLQIDRPRWPLPESGGAGIVGSLALKGKGLRA